MFFYSELNTEYLMYALAIVLLIASIALVAYICR